jgi:DNA-binding NarL/FixJ family response regulator
MDGLHATAEIKARFPATRVAIVSQYDDAELRAEAARLGACAYVLKENLHELPAILAGHASGNCAGGTVLHPSEQAKTQSPQRPTSNY